MTQTVDLADVPFEYQRDLVIEGKTADEVLNLPSSVSLKGNLKIDNIVLKNSATFNFDRAFADEDYTIKLMLLDKNIKPLLGVKEEQISK